MLSEYAWIIHAIILFLLTTSILLHTNGFKRNLIDAKWWLQEFRHIYSTRPQSFSQPYTEALLDDDLKESLRWYTVVAITINLLRATSILLIVIAFAMLFTQQTFHAAPMLIVAIVSFAIVFFHSYLSQKPLALARLRSETNLAKSR